MTNIIAVDIDLHRISVVASCDGKVLDHGIVTGADATISGYRSLIDALEPLDEHVDLALLEVASASSYGKPWHRSRVAWALWNISIASQIATLHTDTSPVLVAPSSNGPMD